MEDQIRLNILIQKNNMTCYKYRGGSNLSQFITSAIRMSCLKTHVDHCSTVSSLFHYCCVLFVPNQAYWSLILRKSFFFCGAIANARMKYMKLMVRILKKSVILTPQRSFRFAHKNTIFIHGACSQTKGKSGVTFLRKYRHLEAHGEHF